MTGLQIKEKIDTNNKIIEKILNPSSFTLNNTIMELMVENNQLQEKCPHSYVGGYCEYCYKEEK